MERHNLLDVCLEYFALQLFATLFRGQQGSSVVLYVVVVSIYGFYERRTIVSRLVHHDIRSPCLDSFRVVHLLLTG